MSNQETRHPVFLRRSLRGERVPFRETGNNHSFYMRSSVPPIINNEATNSTRRNPLRTVEARNNIRRNPSMSLDSEGTLTGNNDILGNRIIDHSDAKEKGKLVIDDAKSVQMPPPPRQKRNFICAVCGDPIVNATATQCGHNFCRECIMLSIASQGKCLTCRKEIRMEDCFEITLPEAK